MLSGNKTPDLGGCLPGTHQVKEAVAFHGQLQPPFKSHGIALEDIATALRVYTLAKERGIGEPINLWA